MASNAEIEVYRALRTTQEKYSYFLLAAAGAAIAFAVNQTQGTTISWSMLPLAIGVSAWGLSFYYGCRHLDYVSLNLSANFDLLKVGSGNHPEIGTHPEMMAAAREGIREAIENNAIRLNKFARRQFRLLITGAVFYVVWHILEMYLRNAM